MPDTVLVAMGTRPEVIKLAPVVRALRATPGTPPLDAVICNTAQHRELASFALATFGLSATHDLGVMRPGQDLSEVMSRVLEGFSRVLTLERPRLVVVQGDTSTAFGCALAAFQRGIPVAHVEAGLRTNDLTAPFPEEGMRQMISRVASLHFCPTEDNREALLREGIDAARIIVTGNPVIDALLWARDLIKSKHPTFADARLQKLLHAATDREGKDARVLLVTAHRRESFGEPLRRIFSAIAELAAAYPRDTFVYPVHPNPEVTGPARQMLGSIANVILVEPLDYLPLIALLDRCHLVITDSGGLQEEAPALHKPVVVLREKTERMEAVESGTVVLAGTSRERIVAMVRHLLDDPSAYAAMAAAKNPYGDGHAADSIARRLIGYLEDQRDRERHRPAQHMERDHA